MPIDLTTQRTGTAAALTAANPVLAVGQIGYETDTRKRKIGDGTTAWTSLPHDIATPPVQAIPGETATATTARINAALAAASAYGTRKTVALVGDFTINAPLVIPAKTTLDATAAAITLASGSNCNILQNAAVSTAVRVVSDAAITAASTTLTSATAAFTSADIGRTVVVTGAGGTSASPAPLSAVISAVTNGTTVTLATAAGTTVTGAAASIYTRDTDITVIGGEWARGSNGGSGVVAHSLRFRRCDRLRILSTRVTSSGGKYAISLGDCVDFTVANPTFASSSDGVHVNGPAARGTITGARGTTADDFVAFTARDYTAYEDVAGDITDMTVANLTPVSCLCPVKLLGGFGTVLRRFDIRDIDGGTGSTLGINIGAENVAAYPSDIDDVLVDGFRTPSTVGFYVLGTIGTLTIRNVSMLSTVNSSYLVNNVDATIRALVIDTCEHRGTGTGNAVLNMAATTCSLERARIRNIRMAPGTSSYIYRSTVAAAATSLTLDGISLIGGGGFIAATAGTLTRARILNAESSGASWLADLGTVTDLYLHGVVNDSPGNGSLNLRATANVQVRGDSNKISGVVSTAAGYALKVADRTFELDLSKITARENRSIAHNTNASLSCGTGVCISDGTTWKNVYSGATY